MIRLLTLLSIAVAVHSIRIRQCTCTEIKPCTKVNSTTVMKCTDQCERHANKTGASFLALRKCFEDIDGSIDGIIKCFKNKLVNTCAPHDNPVMVRKFQPDALKLALLKEINEHLKKSGIRNEMLKFFREDKLFSICRLKCMTDESLRCFRGRRCGLSLPSNHEIVKSLKDCALVNGMDTDGFRKLCHCTANAGARGLAEICDKIVFS
ncbi:hypothetical protein Y032_0006g3159 [Ancylostoma ceylanicum]|uniref:Uncharacterized protein n=1 Tax=Ancylostoma ceylanicum TaxID=53326 RepID=A0A016VSK0_9BILA|nr:hypothetical protein Y032_0006g3159 [Ancylostoma ceylanicum]